MTDTERAEARERLEALVDIALKARVPGGAEVWAWLPKKDGKTQRWGAKSVNPLLPPEQQETNAAWLWREMRDAYQAMHRLMETMRAQGLAPEEPSQ